MKIAVIGAGVIGVTTALELASHGHDVVVFEKGSGIAQQASFATAGFMGPAMMQSWTAPGIPFKTLRKVLFGSDTHAFHGLSNLPFSWFWQWQKASNHPSYKLKLEALQRLAFYSQEVMTGITEQYGLQYENSQGCLLICRQEKDLKNYQLQLDLMAENGISFKKIDPIETTKASIIEKGYATESELDKMEEIIMAQVDESVTFSENSPYPDPADLFRHVYVEDDYPYITD